MNRYDLKCCIFCIFSAVFFFLYWANFVWLVRPPTHLDTVSFRKHKISSNKRRICGKLGQRTDQGHRGGNILDEETLPVWWRGYFAYDGSDDGSDGRHLSATRRRVVDSRSKTLSDQNLFPLKPREPRRAWELAPPFISCQLSSNSKKTKKTNAIRSSKIPEK